MFGPTIEIQFAIGKSTDWLNNQLRDFARNLDEELRRRKKGKAKGTLRLILKISDLPSLALEISEGEGLDEAELRSRLRKRQIVKSVR